MEYIFISTKSRDLELKAKNLFSKFSLIENGMNNRKILIYSSGRIEGNFAYKAAINDFEDNGVNVQHSLISEAKINENEFNCITDFFGILTHYFYYDSNSFICSNNIFLIAYLVEVKISEEAIFDALIFKKPRGDKTWFSNIKCLAPSEKLIYNLDTHKFFKSKCSNLFDSLFEEINQNYIEVFTDFFRKFKLTNSCENIGLSLSAGCDSRTILAGLLTVSKKFKTFSWGGSNYLETYKIKKLIKNLDIENLLVTFDDLIENYNTYLIKAFYITSGLLASVHYYYYYSKLPPKICLFEGYIGSEFVKGELSDGMYTDVFYDVIKENLSVKDSIEKHFPSVNSIWKKKFIDYLNYYYTDNFKNVDTNEGKIEFQKFLIEHLPSKIFAGVLLNGVGLGLKYFLPYFSPIFLKSLFSAGYGIKNNISIRNDFPGSIKIVQAQAKIVKELNKKIYYSILDRNIRFSESFLPLFISNLLRVKRNILKKIKIKNDTVLDQVDFKNILKNSTYHKKGLNEVFLSFSNSNSYNKYFYYVSFYLNLIDEFMSKKVIPNEMIL